MLRRLDHNIQLYFTHVYYCECVLYEANYCYNVSDRYKIISITGYPSKGAKFSRVIIYVCTSFDTSFLIGVY